jgi:subtilisin family serine protease
MGLRGRIAGLTAACLVIITIGTVDNATASAGGASVRYADAPNAIEDHYIVVFKDTVAKNAVSAKVSGVAAQYDAKVENTYNAALSGFSGAMSAAKAKQLAADPAVAYVEQDATISVADTQNDPPWGLDRIDQRNLPLSFQYTYDAVAGNNVHVYVVDSGIRWTHSEFEGRALSGRDFVDDDNAAQDCHGHGTHVAGTIAGKTYGVAKKATVVAVRVVGCDGSGSVSDTISAVDRLTGTHADLAVVNLSLERSDHDSLQTAIERSVAAGLIYTVAAGNSNSDACRTTPANAFGAITVGSTDRNDARAATSNYGTCVDIFAPGVSIRSADIASDTATRTRSGTSMASAHAAGAAALYLARSRNASPARVEYSMESNATTGTVTNRGSGSPNSLLFRHYGLVISSFGCTGTGISITCGVAHSVANPAPPITWYLNGQHIPSWDSDKTVSIGCSGSFSPHSFRVVVGSKSTIGRFDTAQANILCDEDDPGCLRAETRPELLCLRARQN